MSEQYSPKSFGESANDRAQFEDMQYQTELLGRSQPGDARYEEAEAYDAHLKAMQGRSEEDVYNEATQQPDAVDRAIAAGSSQVRFMKALAEQIAILRNKAIDADRADRDVQALKDKEDSFNDRLADYENSEDADPSVIDRLMELATAEQAAAADNSGETGEQTTNSTNFTELPVDEQRKLLRTLFGKELVDQLSDADLAKYAAVGSKLSDKQATAETTPESVALTDEQKAELKKDVEKTILHDIEVNADFKDNDAFIAKLTELRDSLVSDRGITVDEANDAIQSVVDKNYKEAPRLFEAAAPAIDSDAENAASDELLEELQMTPEERKNRDLLKIYRNASEDEMRRINEIAWGENLENPLEGYDPEIARNISDDDAIELMRNAFKNNYKLPIDADSDTEPTQDDDSDAEQDSSDDETEQQDAPTGFLNRLRSRWDNMENRRKKVTRAIAGVALTAIGVTGAVVAYKLHMDHTAVLDAANNLKSGAKAATGHANDPQAFANFAANLKDLRVGAGQGIYDVLTHNGIDKSKVSYAELYDLQRQFPKELYLQQVGNVTDVRITNPGTLSQPLADALTKFASN